MHSIEAVAAVVLVAVLSYILGLLQRQPARPERLPLAFQSASPAGTSLDELRLELPR